MTKKRGIRVTDETENRHEAREKGQRDKSGGRRGGAQERKEG